MRRIRATKSAAEPLKIAFLGPLSGGASGKGLGGRNSAELAVRLRNQKATSLYSYQLISHDDACDPEVGLRAAAQVATDATIIAGVTHYCSTVAACTVSVFHDHELPVVLWGAHEASLTDKHRFVEVHRVCGSNRVESDFAVDFMRQLGFRRWAIAHDSTHYGHDHSALFMQSLKRSGGEIVQVEQLAPDQIDVTSAAERIAHANPDVAYVAAAPPPWWAAHPETGCTPPHMRPGWIPLTAQLRRALLERGVQAVFQGTSGVVRDPGFLKSLGTLAEGALAFEELVPLARLPGGPFFTKVYRAAQYLEPPESFGPYAFAATTLILDIIDRVGPGRRRVREALNAVSDHPSVIGNITFDAAGQNIAAPMATFVVQDGRWLLWDDSEFASGRRQLAPGGHAHG